MREFQTLKSDLNTTRLIEDDSNNLKLGDGEITVKIEKFSFTSNNVTYGVAGDLIGYWDFFPSSDNTKNEWGCIPMWGFGRIIQSKNDALSIGERLFGYFPPSENLNLNPIKITEENFIDGRAHRRDLPPVYNNYIRLSGEKNYDSEMDNIRALLFPLHITAFCLCDTLQDQSYLEASQIIIISASSKTAIGLAQGLSDELNRPKIIGLTSSGNLDFVKSLGCYDEVITYNNLDEVNSNLGSVIVDMAGNQKILNHLYKSLNNNMLKCLTVGMTHWDSMKSTNDVSSESIAKDRTEFFFAPSHIQKRISDWGHEGYNNKTHSFMNSRAMQSKEWMDIKEIKGLDSFISTYSNVVMGKINPNEGIIVTLET